MKILNLYAGIGGNRKLWGNDHDITAIELNPQIAKIYQDFFPQDKVIVADAHQYLLEHILDGWDFIWASPPCPTHSRLNNVFTVGKTENTTNPICYPDMQLYQEIVLLKHHFKGKWCVENVISYYDPLYPPPPRSRQPLLLDKLPYYGFPKRDKRTLCWKGKIVRD